MTECYPFHIYDLLAAIIFGGIIFAVVISIAYSLGADSVRDEAVKLGLAAHSDDVDQSNRFDADQIGAKRRKAFSV